MPVPFVRYEFENSSTQKPRVKLKAKGTKSMPVFNVVGPIEKGTTSVVAGIAEVEDVYEIEIEVTWDNGYIAQHLLPSDPGQFIHRVKITADNGYMYLDPDNRLS